MQNCQCPGPGNIVGNLARWSLLNLFGYHFQLCFLSNANMTKTSCVGLVWRCKFGSACQHHLSASRSACVARLFSRVDYPLASWARLSFVWLVPATLPQPLQPPSCDVANIWQTSFAAPLISTVWAVMSATRRRLCATLAWAQTARVHSRSPSGRGRKGHASITAACVACGRDMDTRPERHLSVAPRDRINAGGKWAILLDQQICLVRDCDLEIPDITPRDEWTYTIFLRTIEISSTLFRYEIFPLGAVACMGRSAP